MTARDFRGLPHTHPHDDVNRCDRCEREAEDLAYAKDRSFTERLADVQVMLARNGHTDGPKAA